MTTEELRDLILSDSEARALADVGNDEACATRCLEIAPTGRRLVPNREIKRRAIIDGYWGILTLTADNASASLPVRALCVNVGEWIKDADATTDFDLQEVQSMLSALVAANLVTSEQAESLDALANVTPNITANMVSGALLPLRPDGKAKAL